MPVSNTSSQSEETENTGTIYRHLKRPEWGCAILLSDRGGKREYQFEDGKKRVFKRAYCDMFKPVDRPLDETKVIKKNLLTRAGRRQQAVSNTTGKAIPLNDQVEYFLDKYENGFRDDAWIATRRGAEGRKRLKRHREGLIEDARELLGKEHIDALLAEDKYDEVVAAMIKLANSTDLTTKRHSSSLTLIRGTGAVEVANALRDLLYGDGEYSIRFEAFVAVLSRAVGKAPSWQLATLFAAAVHPTEHLFVKPKTTDLQAEWMAPGITMTKLPNGPTYERLREMAMNLGERLGRKNMAPGDLLDLHDFMWETMRPKARKDIASSGGSSKMSS